MGQYCFIMNFKVTLLLTAALFIILFITPFIGFDFLVLFLSPIIYLFVNLTYPMLDEVYDFFIKTEE